MSAEKFIQDNAASTVIEVGSVGSFYPDGGSVLITSESVDPNDGLYNIKGIAQGSVTYAIIRIDITGIVIGNNLRISFAYKSTNFDQQFIYQWVGIDPLPSQGLPSLVWEDVTMDVVATAETVQMLFFVTRNAGTAGDILEIDKVSVIDLDAPVPTTTTVGIEWIDSISAAATGNKIYRDDVEIADIGMGVQTYQDATAETGTEYKYEVQAYSATDETTQEVLGVNVQYITTA